MYCRTIVRYRFKLNEARLGRSDWIPNVYIDLFLMENHRRRSRQGDRGDRSATCTSGDNPHFQAELNYVNKLFDNVAEKVHLLHLKCRKTVGQSGLSADPAWEVIQRFPRLPIWWEGLTAPSPRICAASALLD